MRNRCAVLSRERLVEAVWESGYRGDSNIIDVYVGRLRDKVDRPFGCENLMTVRGVGYRIGADGREPDVA
jgi:two-component system OmpR family response regulator